MEEQQATTTEESAVVELDENLEQAAMQAAIAESRGHEPSDQDQANHLVPESEGQAKAATETVAEPQMMFGLTEGQIKAALAKAGEVDDLKHQLRTIHGRYGELNSRIQNLQKAEEHGAVSTEDLSKVEEIGRKYHEAILDGDMDLANKLYIQSLQAMPRGITEQPIQPQVDIGSVLTEQEQKFETKLLRMQHPDYLVQTQTNDFAIWKQTLAPEVLHELDNTWDALFIAEKLTEFKAWKAKGAQSNQQNQQRQQRLSNAVTPQGSAPAAPSPVTEEEAMQAAIRAHLRPRMAAT